MDRRTFVAGAAGAAAALWTDRERAAWRPTKRLPVSEWADQHRVLDPMFSAEPGKWRTSRVPYTREWMDSASLRHVRRITLMASTQVGKTEALNNICGYFVHQDPSPTMIVMPSRETAKLSSERRIMPMVRASPALTAELSDRAHDTRNRDVAFRRCVVYFRSAQSPTDLSSVPVRVVLGDEVDKWPRWSGREASPVALVRERTATYYDHVVVLASTPTTRTGRILTEFELGDQRRYHVACVHCQLWHVLQWRQVRWPADIRTGNDMEARKECWYECPGCGGKIDDKQKRLMVEAGMWIPEGFTHETWTNGGAAADRTAHRSYHIWAAYSPWVPWWKIAAKFLDSKDDPSELMNFTNSWLAEVWEERLEATSDRSVALCVDHQHRMGETPREALVITAAVDVQKDSLHYGVTAWGMDEEHWLVDVGTVETDPTNPGSDWEELAEILFDQTFGMQELPVRIVCVDSRYRRDEVLDFCRRYQPARMIQGVERDAPIPFSAVKIDKHPRTGATLPASMTVWSLNVGYFKDLFAHRVTATATGDPESGKLHLPNDLPPSRMKELASEHKVVERKGNRSRVRWVKKPGSVRNELWDLMTYNTAAARMIRVDTLRSERRRTQRQKDGLAKQQQRAAARPTTTKNPSTLRQDGKLPFPRRGPA